MSISSRESVKVVAICGSLRSKSYTRMALKIALEGAEELGAETHLIDLRYYNLPFCKQYENSSDLPEDVFKLRHEVQKAEGIILGTPDYHGTFSGVLKNALDLMGFDEFESKMVGLLGVAGGSMGSTLALDGLRSVGRQVHAWVVPLQVSIPSAYKQFDDMGNIKDSRIGHRLKELGRQVTRFAVLHQARQSMEFLREWEQAPINPGGR
ncbi:MAG: NADPH-dependent FMN reductase [Candidatus Thorarchaeota archaeon]